MLRTKRLTCARAIVLGLVTGTLSACATPGPETTEIPEDFGISDSALGTPLASCSTAGSSGFGAGQVLTLTLTGGASTVMLSAVGGKITVNGWTCVNSSGASLLTTGAATVAVKKIVINGDPAVAEKVILDILPGTFGASLFSGAAGSGLQVDLGAGLGDSFMVRGTNAKDSYVMGKSAAGDAFFDITGDLKADVRVIGAETYSIALLAGDDIFTARGGAVNATALATGVSTLTAMAQGIQVLGGDGADTLTGGDGNDTINGGAGADTFKTSSGASADGNDVYIGGAGVDTMDYSGRTTAITASIGPQWATKLGTVDLSTLTYPGDLDTLELVVSVDGAADDTVTFAAPADAAAVVSQINAQVGATVAKLDAGSKLVLHAVAEGPASTFEVVSGDSLAVLGLTASVATGASASDGQPGESDDITYTVENITGGTGDDVLTGSDQVNILNGGTGADTLAGVENATCPVAGGDQLTGGAGADIFLMGAYANCGAILTGGTEKDTASFAARAMNLTITVDGTANDGSPAANSGAGEKANVKTDIEVILGGSAVDTITGGATADEIHGGAGDDVLNGGAGDDTLYGGTGNDEINGAGDNDTIIESGNDSAYSPAIAAGVGDDVINGGAGVDKVSYESRTAALALSICVNAALTGAPTGTGLGAECSDADGDALLTEEDNLVNVEWLVGGTGADDIYGAEGDETLEGGGGADELWGGAGSDNLYGDAGNDELYGEEGDDYAEGGAGDDVMDGGDSDGDICNSDAADVTAVPATLNCEL